ncbi:hypothetical protein PC116_g9631 [Phytophthora cactorum]|uniref:Uncharacterized protein n=1 Tax=Phytophthora cactorum TaxID=29920 RepID=A0A8T1E2V0_9STRA|nr:hypothetical protein PC114_g11740 [Phytophthora cactorum]KAG2947669.1 hypothetical protein PC117_g6609 [Phytophthora cactorum]KAG3037429.1 hypothetical protein PC119_g3631 [Phytophthora cactorum]KAG3165449.1 hypothetical protein C6341_g12367 [Phytophthora cactorum]KAG4242465.1 hypothetical protein PC116_g9631 [Phytophthora cactorum]
MRIALHAVSKKDTDGPWKIVHTARSYHHNHEPSREIRVHAAIRSQAARASREQACVTTSDLVELQTAAGVAVSTIQDTVLSADPNSLVLAKDITNTKSALLKRELASHTSIEALFQHLREHNFFHEWRVNPETNELIQLIWAHPATTELFKLHHDVLVADCTYKTNKHRLPLLNSIAITGTNTVLPVAQCWLPGEKEEDFVWVFTMLRLIMIENDIDPPHVILTDRDLACLNSLDCVFPDVLSMICRWHMNKNAESMARKHLGQVDVENPAPGQPKKENSWQTNLFMATFYKAVDAISEEEFEEKRKLLAWKSKMISAYLDLHWWKYKSRVVRYCTNKYTHYGVRDTSTVEGTHAKIKAKLKTSQGDLYTVFKKQLGWWTIAASETSVLMARHATIAPHLLQKNRYNRVVRIITATALKETEELWIYAEKIINGRIERSPCSGEFRVLHGRPCVHELIAIIKSNGRLFLTPRHFDKHWWIYRDQDTAPHRIQDPATIQQGKSQKSKRRMRLANQGTTGTGRDPTLSERIDQNQPATPLHTTTQPSLDLHVFGTQDSDRIVQFELPFLPARAWGCAERAPYPAPQASEE